MSTKNDFGASHVFGKPENKVYAQSILKVSKTMYIKTVHLEFIHKYADEHDMNDSSVTDLMLQRGIAYTAILESEKK